MFANPSIQDFKDKFVRDFPYGTDPTTTILDTDIANAYMETNVEINQELFVDQSSYTLGYLLLSAHNMVMNIKASSQGISGQFNWNQVSKSVGSVSESFQVPQRIMDNPAFSMLTKTPYGAKYLNLILPYLSGVNFTVAGRTRP